MINNRLSTPDVVVSLGRRLTSMLVSSAPLRPKWRAIAVATVTSSLALLVLAALTELTAEPLLIPPLAASMALVVGAPQLPLAQPRNVVGGQVVSAAVGITVGLLGHTLWLGAVAGGLALGAMMLCRMPHSPAAATAMIGVGTPTAAWEFVLLVAIAALVLISIGVVGNRLNGSAYPSYVW